MSTENTAPNTEPNTDPDAGEPDEQVSGNQEQQSTAPKPGEKPDPYAAFRGRELTSEEASELLDKLKAANGEAAANRHKLREFEQKAETEAEKAVREAKETGMSEAEAKYHPILIKLSAASELTAAGAASGHASLIRLFDNDAITVNDDGTVEGVKEEVARIKKEFPGLFTAASEEDEKPKRRVVPGAKLDAGTKPPVTQKKTSAQLHAERVLGQNR